MLNPLLAQLFNPATDKDAMFKQMQETNPQFAKFVEDNKGKSMEQIAKENGLNPDFVKFFIK